MTNVVLAFVPETLLKSASDTADSLWFLYTNLSQTIVWTKCYNLTLYT